MARSPASCRASCCCCDHAGGHGRFVADHLRADDQRHFNAVPHYAYLIQGGIVTMPSIWIVLFLAHCRVARRSIRRRNILIAAMIVYAFVGIAPTFLDSLYAIIVSRMGVASASRS